MLNQFLLPNIVFPIVELTSASRFWSLYRELNALQSADQQIKASYQLTALCSLLQSASANTLYWQEVFSELGISDADISIENVQQLMLRLPVTEKQTYSNGFPDRVTAQLDTDSWQYLSSAGTTGRMTVVTDFVKRDYLRAAEHLNLRLAIQQPLGIPTLDIPPSACNVVCGFADSGPEPLLPYIWWSIKNASLFHSSTISDIRGRVERQVLLKRKTLLPIEPGSWQTMVPQLDEYLDMIRDEKIQLVRALPHFLLWLAQRARQRNLTFDSVRAVIPYGGLASEQMVRQIKASFSAPFINVYGTGEVGAIGCAVDGSEAISIYQGMVYIEILDSEQQPVPVGETGKIVVTDLNNKAMPIIRYAIGDIGRLMPSTDGQQRLELFGRQQESFINGAGQLVTARALHNLFFSYDCIANFKVEQVTNTVFKATVMLDDGADEPGQATAAPFDKDVLAAQLQTLLGSSKKPQIKTAAFISPETSGKYLALKLSTPSKSND